jgi:hypothetical protein
MTGKDADEIIGKLDRKLFGCGAIIIAIAIATILIIATSCGEEVITVREPGETFYVPLPYYVVEVDTVEKEHIVYEIRDSIIYVHDTVYQTKTDTTYISAWYVYPTYQNMVDRFYRDAVHYGWDLPKNNLVMVPWETDEAQGTSTAYQDGHQWYVKIHVLLRHEGHYIAIYRELGRALLGKPYTNDAQIMDPEFNPFTFTTQDYDSAIARPYLDKLFEK